VARNRLLALGLRAAGALAGLAAASLPAGADANYCGLNHGPGTIGFNAAWASGTWLCADAGTSGATGWEPVVTIPDGAGAVPFSAAQSGSSGGVFAASASADATAAPGLLRARAEASSMGDPGAAYSFGGSNATFLERGTLAPLGGASPGTPVDLRLTIEVSGAFLGNGAGGDVDVFVYRAGSIVHQRALVTNILLPSVLEEIDLTGFAVGDDLAIWMGLYAFAGASSDQPQLESGLADLGNSARLHLDVESGNAAFESTSGYDYTSVPEPSAALLLAAGAAALATCAGARRAARTE